MRRLNDGQQQTELFKELFLEQLPISTRQILAGLANDLSLDTLAERADAMIKFDSVNIIRRQTHSIGTEVIRPLSAANLAHTRETNKPGTQ